MFHASIVALELPDDRALMAAMGNEDLEARLAERERAAAVAPADVSTRLDSVERQRAAAVKQADQAQKAADAGMASSAEELVRIHDGQLSGLRVADAAHREGPRRTPGWRPRPWRRRESCANAAWPSASL